ncbi:MAG TPA: insulinase family protein [Caldisericia bacterium]|nr:insulinase family protein [Caldisericia bacterium]
MERSKALAHAIIGIKAEWRNEKIEKRGITHFLEHAIFLGNKCYPTPNNQVAKYGVQLEGMTLPEYTIFFFTSAKEDFTEILSIFLSLIFNPKFNKVKLEKEKKDKIITAVIQESDFTP